ncbi:MAG: hypothetical protein QOE33_756 [Acidobacteriota bacterium]|nr:hypothetical protein [Acidobacteriota bacterium]
MAETKPKQASSLRTPKPKKMLGLTVPPALRLPHEDLIGPSTQASTQKDKSVSSLTSQTTTTSQTSQTSPSQPQLVSDNVRDGSHKLSESYTLIDSSGNYSNQGSSSETSLTSQTSLTSETSDLNSFGKAKSKSQLEPHPVSPKRDFTKFANSINREAVPSGLFTGKSKQLYDCLYSLTRGAIVPARSIRISRPKLMKQANIGSRVTFDANIERLANVGLISVRQIIGEHDGNEYTVFLPEENSYSEISRASHTSHTSVTSPAQNLDRLVGLETSLTSQSLSSIKSEVSGVPKTSFKTKDDLIDDEAFARFVSAVKRAVIEITGRAPNASDAGRWEELAEVLITELKIAAGRTTVSNVPAFLAEHLRRRLWKKEKRQIDAEALEQQSSPKADVDASKCPDCFGTGMYYPNGFEKGVARCPHKSLLAVKLEE